MTEDSQLRHASCVAVGGRGVLIEGPSGAGKSMLALHMMALGASLVADDRVLVLRRGGDVMADAPPGLPAAIEARGIGLLAADLIGPVALHVVVDLAQAETKGGRTRFSSPLVGEAGRGIFVFQRRIPA